MNAAAGRMLLVDDDPSARALLKRVVADMGYEARTAESRGQARDMLRAEEFRVLVTDVSLEESDSGVLLAREARLLHPGLPVVLITGSPDLETALPALRGHAFDYLAKPFPLEEFRRVLRRAAAETRDAAPAREELREELAAAYGELKKVERLREGMLAVLDHELRTPMCMAKLAAEELSNEDASPRGVLVRQLMGRALARLEAEIGDILLHARLTAERPPRDETVVSLGELCGEAARSLAEEAAARSVRVEILRNASGASARGDRAQLASAVRHLIANAVRFNRKGGRVLVRAERDGDRVTVEVADEGGGIPPEHLPRVFDPYYQAAHYLTRSTGGLGLGLAIARGVFEGHGGGIGVTNRPGVGCEFRAWLPAFAPAAAG
jgi:signal transduction histidine kinase